MLLSEYYNLHNDSSFIPSDLDFTFLQDYKSNYEKYDFYFLNMKYKSMTLEFEETEKINKLISAFFLFNKYKYETLYNTTVLTYNPIENYSMTEKNERTVDAHTDNMSIGARKMTQGEQIGESITSNKPFDSNDFVQTNKANSTINSRVDTSDSATDSNTYGLQHEINELKRSGNIGVTSSQQMLQSERTIALFSLYSTIFDDLLTNICKRVMEG